MNPFRAKALHANIAYIEQRIEEKLCQKYEGRFQQMLIIGSGFDDLGLRLSIKHPKVSFWQVEFPFIGNEKERSPDRLVASENFLRISGIRMDLGNESLAKILSDARNESGNHFCLSRKTMVFVESLTSDLEEEVLYRLFKETSEVVGNGSILEYEFTQHDAIINHDNMGWKCISFTANKKTLESQRKKLVFFLRGTFWQLQDFVAIDSTLNQATFERFVHTYPQEKNKLIQQEELVLKLRKQNNELKSNLNKLQNERKHFNTIIKDAHSRLLNDNVHIQALKRERKHLFKEIDLLKSQFKAALRKNKSWEEEVQQLKIEASLRKKSENSTSVDHFPVKASEVQFEDMAHWPTRSSKLLIHSNEPSQRRKILSICVCFLLSFITILEDNNRNTTRVLSNHSIYIDNSFGISDAFSYLDSFEEKQRIIFRQVPLSTPIESVQSQQINPANNRDFICAVQDQSSSEKRNIFDCLKQERQILSNLVAPIDDIGHHQISHFDKGDVTYSIQNQRTDEKQDILKQHENSNKSISMCPFSEFEHVTKFHFNPSMTKTSPLIMKTPKLYQPRKEKRNLQYIPKRDEPEEKLEPTLDPVDKSLNLEGNKSKSLFFFRIVRPLHVLSRKVKNTIRNFSFHHKRLKKSNKTKK